MVVMSPLPCGVCPSWKYVLVLTVSQLPLSVAITLDVCFHLRDFSLFVFFLVFSTPVSPQVRHGTAPKSDSDLPTHPRRARRRSGIEQGGGQPSGRGPRPERSG